MSDLTRWNRAGLSRFRYVNGNAATYLEVLRQALADRFPGRWDTLGTGVPEDLPNEPGGDRLARLLEQYRRERGDWGWEIARALARACHVLTEHLDVYANEGYLGTADQWDDVRRLVEMLDYSPAPPASATTRVVLTTKGEGGTVDAGFQVQHTPPDGGAPVLFETLEDLEVDPALDALRPEGWNRSPRTFAKAAFEDGAAGPSPFGSRPCLALQGVGPVYARWLDRLLQLESGDPAARFRIRDFRRLAPEKLAPLAFRLPERPRHPVQVLRLRLRELKGKADVLLDVAWSAAELAPLLGRTLAELVAEDPGRLALRTGHSSGEMERLQETLRQVEIVLDQPVFEETRLRELVAEAVDGDGDGDGARKAPHLLAPRSRRSSLRVRRALPRSTTLASPAAPAPASSPWIAPEKSKISAVDLGLVVRDPGTAEAVVVTVDRVDPLTRAVFLRDAPHQQGWRHWTEGETSLHVKAGFLRRPRMNGPDVVTLETPHDLGPGEVVAWEEDAGWSFARVEESDERALRLADGPRPGPATEVYRAFAVERSENGLLFPFDFEAVARWTGQGFLALTEADSTPEGTGYRRLNDTRDLASVLEIFLVPAGAAPVGTVTAVKLGELTFDGKPGKLGSGQWVVADDGDALWPVTIGRITEREDHFMVALEPSATPPHGAGHRPVGDQPCIAVQGVGAVYSEALKEAGIETVQDLHDLDAAGLARLNDVSPVRRWEMKTKADVLLGLEADAGELAPIADRTPGAVIDLSTEELSDLLGRPAAAAEELQDHLRMCEACLDHGVFRELRIRDLLPETPARATEAPSGPVLPDRLVRLYGLFEHTLRPTGWDRNDTPLTGDRIVLDVVRTPRLLALGRRLFLEREVSSEDGDDPTYAGAVETRVQEVDDAARAVTLDLAEPLTREHGFTLGNAVLRGNVVPAGHGETRPEKVLGSGDAARSNQRFVLAEQAVSFVADATQPSGVRADVTVRVDGRAWEQVANLRDSGPADADYAVRMTEEGHLAVELGDGRHGRRLPTGGNNVRIRFRTGTGLAGNLPAGSLNKAARPHRLVGSVRQPLAATGGNDMEDVRSLKENAPASVLTLERAVSVSDLSHLAARQSSVWQARAFPVPTALSRRESVEVVVVPPDGGELGDLERTLREFLEANTLPGVDVRVSPAEMTPFHVSVTVRVKSAEYDPEVVAEHARGALLDAFSLQRRRLGQDLFLSEIYQVVEGVVGVESSTCAIEGNEDGNGPSRRLEALPGQVFHLDPAESDIRLRHEEWTL